MNGEIVIFCANLCLRNCVVYTFHWILDHFIQPLIDGIIHVVPFRDLNPFVFLLLFSNELWTFSLF